MKNEGLQNEKEIVLVLNGKKFYELSEFWKRKMRQLYRDIKDDDKIECYKCVYNQKADITIRVGEKKWNISIKSGYFVSVHTERLSSFAGFLRELGIKEELIRTLKLYHYGDGTIDGSGEKRLELEDIKKNLASEIEEFNKEVNKKEILEKIATRFLVEGTPFQRSYVSHLYSGTKIFGSMIDMKMLIDYITNKFNCNTVAIHFGPFIYTPAYRGVEKFDPDNVKRYYINIKWPSLNKDMRDAKYWYFSELKEKLNDKLYV